MYTSGSDVYNALVESNGVTKDWGYGLTAMPSENGGGALTGGTLAAVTKDSTDAQKDAAVKWIDWWYLSKLQDQNQAVADAKTRADADPAQAVGTRCSRSSPRPTTRRARLGEGLHQRPARRHEGLHRRMFTQKLVPEASASVQDLYGQAVPRSSRQ
jgi:hypothetical protein